MRMSFGRAMALLLGASLYAALSAACGAKTPLPPAEIQENPWQRPKHTERLVFDVVDKVDLLFVIDNSISMADKQELLSDAVPTLLERLINPPCISLNDRNDVRVVTGPEAVCPTGYQKDFEPLIDLHVGVVTSSLGGHGGEICSPNSHGNFNETKNDRGRLLGTLRPELGLPTYNESGFLAWDPAGVKEPRGDDSVSAFIGGFQSHVTGAGEVGCGYEATQEAWYRFLVDPDPPLDMANDGIFAISIGTDSELLAQRTAFLRDDSLLMVVVLSDEDDCSVIDGQLGWLAAQVSLSGAPFNMPSAASACSTDPNSPCCRSCGLNERREPEGCLPLNRDPGCVPRDPTTDSVNLRCYRQKERFGFDLLYPTRRYVDALSELFVSVTRNCEGETCPLVPNPLFRGTRDPSMVIYTAIVGVPWQDIATGESLTGPGLEYLTPEQLVELDRWQLLLGDPESGAPAGDPLMRASIDPRSGTHPVTGEAVAPPESTDPRANSINGHEYLNTDRADLQYACTFGLAQPRDCSPNSGAAACDCTEPDLAKNRPLCNPPAGGAATTTQYYAKAYPGPRHLEIARDLGARASIASICPKVHEPPTSAPAYGFNPAAEHMYLRLSGGLGERCLPRRLPHQVDGTLECVLWQLRESTNGCDCEALGLEDIERRGVELVEQALRFEARFRGVDVEGLCACQLPQASGHALAQCQRNVAATGVDAWCSVDPEQGVGSPEFVSDCRVGQPRTLRMLGSIASLRQTDLLLTCYE